MPIKNTAITMCIAARNTVTNLPATGEASNLTLRGVGDGTEYTPSSPSITEMDSTNLKGVYKFSLTAGENNYSAVLVGGICSTANVELTPVQWANEVSADVVKFGGTAGTFASGRPEVNTTKIEGSDATDQIRDAILNDATRFAGANVDAAITTRAPASTALSTAQWTNVRAALLDYLDVAISSRIAVTSSLGSESYAADGAVPTVAQMQFMIWSLLANFDFSGLVRTCRALDKATSAMTFAIDSETDATSQTRQA